MDFIAVMAVIGSVALGLFVIVGAFTIGDGDR